MTLSIISEPEVTRTVSQDVAFIHITIPRHQIREVMGPGIAELTAAVAAQGITTAGSWFTHHRKMEAGIFDFEISLPVSTPVVPAGRMESGRWPAMRVVRTVYEGPYDKLPSAWREFDGWIFAKALLICPDLWECYTAGPEATRDPAHWRTELYRQLAD